VCERAAVEARAPIVIAFHNRPFPGMGVVPAHCTVAARFTHDPAERVGADAVLFHLPTLDPAELVEARRPPGQVWVAWSLESRVMCPLLDDAAAMARFDLTMTYERSSDVWHPYFGPELLPQLRAPVTARTQAAPVVWLQSNGEDATGRVAYVAELLRRVRVDSYGRLLRTRAEVVPPGTDARVALYQGYKFALAFENSVATDYVTERIFDALRAGAVPVYRGCPEVADLLPSPSCYIDASRFSSATELGAHLDHLDRDDEAYGGYQRWRDEPLAPAFLAHLQRLREPPLCRLAAAVARHAAARRGPGT
jgi:hypothetical protein